MGRSTQWIGLTKDAMTFVRGFTRVTGKRTTHGMFGEPIALGTWLDEVEGKIYHEVVQDTPWSSGPMILTCLAEQRKGEPAPPSILSHEEEGFGYHRGLFMWVQKPTMDFGIDKERGCYWA